MKTYHHSGHLAVAAAVAAGLLAFAGAAFAADEPTLTRSEAKDLKTQSNAEYKARHKVADANKALDKADCEVAADGSVERACKSQARADAKAAKAEAKTIRNAERAEIKAHTQ